MSGYNNNTMESDRRSNVSSFYGGKQNQYDPFSSSAPTPTGGAGGVREGSTRGGRDNLSIAERYSRTSNDILRDQPTAQSQTQAHHASQNSRGSYFPVDEEGGFNPYSGDTGSIRKHSGGGGRPSVGSGSPLVHSPPGEGDDQGWDVFNDFNNAGPRYSDAFGGGIRNMSNGYSRLTPDNSSIRKAEPEPLPEGVELVTVPALGPDWKKSEIEGMRSATKRAEKNDARREAMTQFWRDQRKCCGLSRKVIAFFLFGLCVVVAILLAITLPRVPGFAFNAQEPLSNNTQSTSPFQFSRTPANFTFPALLNIQIDTHSNVIPMHIESLSTEVFDLNSDVQVGEGKTDGGFSIPAKKLENTSIPIVFKYVAPNATDPTWLDFYNACQNKGVVVGGVRPGFNLRVILKAKITGLIKTVSASTTINKVPCPFELPTNSV